MTLLLSETFNLRILQALVDHNPPKQAPATGTKVRVDLGELSVLIDRCADGVLRVARERLEQLVDLQAGELGKVMPELLSQHEVRLLSITVDYRADTVFTSHLLTALAEELKRVQPLVNLSSKDIRRAVDLAGPDVVLTPNRRGTGL